MEKRKAKLYDTKAKRLKAARTKGKIITFKKPFRWMGEDYMQILVQGIEKRGGHFKIVGFARDSEWYKSMDDLLKAIDWKLMEEWHRGEIDKNDYM